MVRNTESLLNILPGIEMVYSTEFTGIDDKVFNVNVRMYVPFYNSGYTDDVLTTKEFKKK